ncbi:hypothetical protein H2200_003353 [Cladophialophora chaetospira]|uniref:Uncharacterized protein n=1 Tax=Cladophialophora chaetospira TaxID=386627 RepID=A0AA38XHW6_9EURO|nr:hypothetical protein H2200_003353 [Cladophialophora chaetospira]
MMPEPETLRTLVPYAAEDDRKAMVTAAQRIGSWNVPDDESDLVDKAEYDDTFAVSTGTEANGTTSDLVSALETSTTEMCAEPATVGESSNINSTPAFETSDTEAASEEATASETSVTAPARVLANVAAVDNLDLNMISQRSNRHCREQKVFQTNGPPR